MLITLHSKVTAKCHLKRNITKLSVSSNRMYQSLNLAGTRVCRPDLVTWLLGWNEMSPPRKTMISSSGLSLAGLSWVFSTEVGVAGQGALVWNRCHVIGCCRLLFGGQFLSRHNFRSELGKSGWLLISAPWS